MESIKSFKDRIVSAKSIAIIGHIDPDTDALASMVATKKLIISNFDGTNKEIHLFAENFMPNELQDPITKDEVIGENELSEYDLAISCDSPTLSRLGNCGKIFESAKHSIMIDHHSTAENYGEINYIYKCSSCCELIYIIFKALGIAMSNDVLKLIYAGIVTDTVNFTQGTVRISSYKVVAEIVSSVGDLVALDAIKDHFLKSNTKNNAILLERALRSLRFYLDDRLGIMKITKADFLETNATSDDTLGIVNHAINIKGVYIAILFIKQEDGSYYASIRSKNGVNISKIASALGGGGHDTVAAFTYKDKLAGLKPRLLELCEEALADTSTGDNADALFDD